jgi:NitT/TauT family transport system substrate-binding protein
MQIRSRPATRGLSRPRRRWHRPLMVLGIVSLLAGACGGESPGGQEAAPGPGGDGAPAKVKIGILPIADVAPIWYGIDKGFFAAEKLEVETVPAQGGAAIVPSVISGEYQFGFGNTVSLMLARQNNVNVQLVSNLVNGADTPDRGTNALMVMPGRGIESVKDMAGKKFAVTTVKNAGEVTVRATLESANVDHSDISFAEYGFPNMNAMVQGGQVDVAWQAEPFITLGKDAGLKAIADPMYATQPNMTIAGIFASEEWLSGNADVANRFKRALARSITEARADEAGIRRTIGAKTQTPPTVLDRIALANWQSDLNVLSIEHQGELAAKYGILEEKPDVGAMIWAP